MDKKKKGLVQILGPSMVIDAEPILKQFAEDHSFAKPNQPSLLVKPENTGEIREIIKWANATKTPLVPVSSGPPHFNGDTVPTSADAVMVDLSRMKKIIKVDRRNKMALIEPGVTYEQLQPALAENGLRLSSTLHPKANKSVVASLLEREPRLIPRYQWAMLDPLRCLEVVWGDGNVFTTGEVSRPGQLEREWQKKFAQVMAAGPAQVDFYKLVSAAQGSMGIVSWASVKCEILPELHELFLIPSTNIEDLLNFGYQILKYRFGDEIFLLNNVSLGRLMGEGSELPPWVLVVAIAGRNVLPRERVDYQLNDIREIARKHGLELLRSIGNCESSEILHKALNPSRKPYWKFRHKGDCRDIFFLTTLDKTPELVASVRETVKAHGYPASDIGIYLQPVHQGASCHAEFSLPFDPQSSKEISVIEKTYVETSKVLLSQGAYFSRPYHVWADMVFKKDAMAAVLLKKIKSVFDPNNIMNPGKLCF